MDRRGILELALKLFPFDHAYPQQEEFMKRMIDTLIEGKVGIFESPTGTGKTLSLLCAALAFQQTEIDFQSILSNDENHMEEPEWIRNSRNTLITADEPKKNSRPKFKSRKRSKMEPTMLDLDDQLSSLLKSLESDEEYLEEPAKLPKRKIFFCSRTHSQLSQVMGELQKIIKKAVSLEFVDLHEFLAITLGSRANLCVNKDVAKLSTVMRVNERCLELQNNTEGSCCPYYNDEKKHSLDLLESSIKRLQVSDIEDMHGLGVKVGACPYYTAKKLQEDAQFVTISYNVLLHKETREAFGVDLQGALIIIDEAHNLIDAINGIYSILLPLDSIEKTLTALSQYHDKYGKRLSPSHSLLIQQLLQALAQLTAFGKNFVGLSKIYRINDFLHASKIDNFNVYPIQAYANESHLSQKISGFYEAGPAEMKDTNLLNDVLRFLEMLTSSDDDGRVYLQLDGESITFKYISLSPENFFSDVIEQAHAVVLAGGTMTPFNDYVDQLFEISFLRQKILQFSCDHLIPKENAVAITLGSGPTGIPFDFSFSNRSSKSLIQELGQTVINMINITPDGIVCFFPSYSYMNQVIEDWSVSDILASIKAKRNVIVESSTVTNIDSLMDSYREAVLRNGSKGGILFGVMGGRLSEGINFSDRLARLVIVIGMPFPNPRDPEMAERINHFVKRKEQVDPNLDREFSKSEFLENRCMRSVNQTLGRVIRHKDDFAGMLLLDSRYKQPRVQQKLSGWVQNSLMPAESFGVGFGALVKVGARAKS